MLLGLAAPTSGRALVFGRPYAELEHPALRIGAVLEATDFHPGRSGRDHLRMLGRAVGLPDSRADEVLRPSSCRMPAGAASRAIRLACASGSGSRAALLGDPELLVLDEPANGLDPEGVRWLRDFLRAFAAQGRTVLISSHVLSEVAQTVDQVLIINHGRLVVESSLEDLTARVGGSVRVRTPQPAQLLQALTREHLEATRRRPHAASSAARQRARRGDRLRRRHPAPRARHRGSSLEEIFLELTSEADA